MRLLTLAQFDQLIKNGEHIEQFRKIRPVVKIKLPNSNYIWLLSAIDPESPNIAYCLSNNDSGFSVYEKIDLNDLLALRNVSGMGIEVDQNFNARFDLYVYQAAEWWYGYMIEDEKTLKMFESECVLDQLKLF